MKSRRRGNLLSPSLFSQLANLHNESSRRKFLSGHPKLLRPEVVTWLAARVLEDLRVNTRQALRLAETTVSIARKLHLKEPLARGLRAKANALYAVGQNKQALNCHKQALGIFQKLGNFSEAARTWSASIQPLILLGEYDQAFAAAENARKIFAESRDEMGLIHVENNLGNILHRQDRFDEALACYERAYRKLLPLKKPQDTAIALSNMSVCLISLNDFPRALATYERARTECEEHGLSVLKAQADYNIAYLYYLRGEYIRAIEMLHATRESCKKNEEAYHLALCHLDLSEIYLELNLSAEAAEMAREGFIRFRNLGMGYEAAKTLANEAIALGQRGKAVQALELFGKARAMFVREKNLVWPWLIDLYRALVFYNEGRYFEARQLCARAAEFFRSSILPGKAVFSYLLLARLSFETGDLEGARRDCERGLDRLTTLEAPVLRYQAHFLIGQIHQAAGNRPAAYDAYQKAKDGLEALRSRLRGEELKMAFMKNKLEVYENLVELCLSAGAGRSLEEAFGYMELAKSRNLTEVVFQRGHSARFDKPGESTLVREIQDLREELNWYYHRIELEQLRPEERSPARIEQLEKQARDRENALLRALRELPFSERETTPLVAPAAIPLETIRERLAADTILVEYFSVGDRLLAALVTLDGLEIVPVTLLSRVASLLQMLRLQLSKFRLGAAYLQAVESSLLQVTQSHLRELYEELLAPVRDRLKAQHLVFVPHGALHYLPFHALFDGQRYLIDSFKVSYAPSAGIFALCHSRSMNPSGQCLVLGVPDARAPFISEEVQAVAAILPQAELFVGTEASRHLLSERGAASRVIHIATHGNFRQDNPMFSGIRMGDSYLNLYDLYQLKLPADLVTLSGCATGLNVVAAGDELLGLIRGLLCAGAQSLLLTLWDVHDKSTAEFMKYFYCRLRNREDKASALQGAMLELREGYAHPYYWAPFFLVGKVSPAFV